MEKIPVSKAVIRFQDCDPFNHLNNAKYLDYFINAREDQLVKEYQLDIFKIAAKQGRSWVVASNQIAYFKPAMVMEEVVIETQLIAFSEKSLQVEMRMLDNQQNQLKSLLWGRFTHFDLRNLKPISHMENYGDFFSEIVLPVAENSFEERTKNIVRDRQLDSV